jgi:hypothetical protein
VCVARAAARTESVEQTTVVPAVVDVAAAAIHVGLYNLIPACSTDAEPVL